MQSCATSFAAGVAVVVVAVGHRYWTLETESARSANGGPLTASADMD